MIEPLLFAGLFLGIGIVLIRSARENLQRGWAETEERDIISRQDKPRRFTWFVIAQMAGGGVALLAGLALTAATLWFG